MKESQIPYYTTALNAHLALNRITLSTHHTKHKPDCDIITVFWHGSSPFFDQTLSANVNLRARQLFWKGEWLYKGEEAGIEEAFRMRDREIKATVKSSTLVQGAWLSPSLPFGVFSDVASMAFCTGPSVRKKEEREAGSGRVQTAMWGAAEDSLTEASHTPLTRALKWMSMWPSKESFSIDPSSGKGFSSGFQLHFYLLRSSLSGNLFVCLYL